MNNNNYKIQLKEKPNLCLKSSENKTKNNWHIRLFQDIYIIWIKRYLIFLYSFKTWLKETDLNTSVLLTFIQILYNQIIKYIKYQYSEKLNIPRF